MSDGPVFVERIDYEAAAREVGLTWGPDIPWDEWHEDIQAVHLEDARRILAAALVGVREAKEVAGYQQVTGSPHIVEWLAPRIGNKEATHSRFVTEWEEVEE